MSQENLIPNCLQLIFQDCTGVHVVVNNQGGFTALQTIAIALQVSGSATFVRIVEIVINKSNSADAGVSYITRYEWAKA